MKNVKILDIATYLPKQKVTNEAIEAKINHTKNYLSAGVIEKLFGIKERRFAAAEEMVSDLAAKAAQPILERMDKTEIDFMIFAAACSDLIEPATANIVQQKLGLSCPVMDLKNACNSFVSAIHTATAFIQAGIYKKILIVNGEKLSDAINFNIQNTAHLKRSLSAFSLGDAGTAALIGTAKTTDEGFYFQKFKTSGEHWRLCTIKGGGSMFPHDVSQNYFEGKTAELKTALLSTAFDFLHEAFREARCHPKNIDWLFTHQVSVSTFNVICDAMKIPSAKCVNVFDRFGNTAAASIPLALHHAIQNNWLKKGDNIAILGLAAGVSASLQLMRY